MRRPGGWPIAGLFAVLLALLVLRWQGLGFSPVTVVLALTVLFGLPAALWLVLGRRTFSPRPLPRLVWIGLGLVVAGFGGAFAGVASPSGVYQVPSFGQGGPAASLRFVPVPNTVEASLAVAFPALRPARVLTNGGGVYEAWLARPGEAGYRLQVTLTGPPFGAPSIRVENLQWNTAYQPRSGRALPLGSLRRLSGMAATMRGPFVFPGYVLFVSLPGGAAYVVDRLTGHVVNGEAW